MLPNLFGKPKMKPATAINSNAWYHVTEGQVDKAGRKFTSMLQVDESTGGLKVSPVTNPPFYWQFQAVDAAAAAAAAAHYVVRNSRDGAARQLSACRNQTEPADGQTGLCMAAADGADDAQVWRLDQWGSDMARDGLRFINAANGTRFWLDVHHKGINNPPFMNNNVTAADADDVDAEGEPAQRWYMTSAQAVNAIEYSTIRTIIPTSTASTTAAAGATTADPAATVSPAASSDSSNGQGGLSTGAQAGIGITVGLASVALGVAALLLWRRRKKQTAAAATTSSNTASPPGTPNTNKPLPLIDHETKVYELPSERFDAGSHYSYQPQELPTPTGPSPQMAREIQAQQRYELDSTPVSPAVAAWSRRE